MGSMYGHAGIGGAVAFGDVDKKIGFLFYAIKCMIQKICIRLLIN